MIKLSNLSILSYPSPQKSVISFAHSSRHGFCSGFVWKQLSFAWSYNLLCPLNRGDCRLLMNHFFSANEPYLSLILRQALIYFDAEQFWWWCCCCWDISKLKYSHCLRFHFQQLTSAIGRIRWISSTIGQRLTSSFVTMKMLDESSCFEIGKVFVVLVLFLLLNLKRSLVERHQRYFRGRFSWKYYARLVLLDER